MRLLIVYCHPDPESFNAALRDTVIAAAEGAGHEVKLIDLHAEGFDPVMGREERAGYHTPGENEAPVRAHLDRVLWAEGIVFVYPTWWYGQPAMLKGWLDRVLVPHVTFRLPNEEHGMGPGLLNIRLIGVVTTLGSPWWLWTLAIGAPGRKVLLRGIRAICNPRCRTLWLGLHGMDTTTAAERAAFLARVRRRIGAIR
jgi:putative NADPH-quinone reductase